MKCPLCQVDLAPDATSCHGCRAPLPGALLGTRYAIQALLGKGGMGVVYKAWDSRLEETVAVKVLRSEALAVDRIARRFRREIKLARKVRHPNVCAIHEYGETESQHYIVMELVDGVDLARALRANGRLPMDEALAVIAQVADGLQAMHEAGIVHRDLKPSNVMRDGRGIVRIMDFGIAKPVHDDESATTIGLLVGTPEYMSPEQAQGERLDFRSDVYAMGVFAFELMTAVSPFRGRTPIKTLLSVLHDPPPLDRREAAHVPSRLRDVLRRAMAKERARRFESIRDLQAALLGSFQPGRAKPSATPVKPPSRDERETALRPAPLRTELLRPSSGLGRAQVFFDEGVESLRGLDAIAAREAFEKATFLEPSFALARSRLAEVLATLGHDDEASAAARTALMSGVQLPAEERRLVDAFCRTAMRDLKRAIEAFAELHEAYPNDVEYGLGLARAQLANAGGALALSTLARLRDRNPDRLRDPRIDLLEAEAAGALSDWERQRAAAACAAQQAAASGFHRMRALAAVEEALSRRSTGDFEAAALALEEAGRALSRLGDPAAAARAFQALAQSHLERGKLTRARLLFESALATCRQQRHRRGSGLALAGIARVALLRGDLGEAARLCSEALTVLQKVGPAPCSSATAADLGEVLLRQGDLPGAGRLLDEAIASLRALGARQRLGCALSCAAELSARQGNLARARAAFQEALAVAKEIGDAGTTAKALASQAVVLAAAGEAAAARAVLEEAVAAASAAGAGLVTQECSLLLGRMMADAGHAAEAERLARGALQVFNEEACRDAAARAEALLARALLVQGRTERAWQACRRALTASERSADPGVRFQVTLSTTRLRLAMGRPNDSLVSLEGVLADLTRGGCYAEQLEARLLLGEIEIAAGNAHAGKARLAAVESEAAARGLQFVESLARNAASR